MQPFVKQPHSRLQMHWWITAGLAAAFSVWAFELIPGIHPASTGTVEDAEIGGSGLPETDPFDDELANVFADSPVDDNNVSAAVYRPLDERGAPIQRAIQQAGFESSKLTETPEMGFSDETLAPEEPAEAIPGLPEEHRSDSPGTAARGPRLQETLQPIPDGVASQLRKIEELLGRDAILDAHAELSRIYWSFPEHRRLIQDQIDESAAVIFTTPDRQFGPPHFVEYGETLESISAQYEVPWEYLARLNRVSPEKLQAGQKLKVVRGPFGAVVDLSRFCLTIHAHGWYVRRYQVGIGSDEKTPLGQFTVEEKLENPTWYNPDGGVIEADDPENPLGEYWIGLGNHIGIHGTNDPTTIGRAASRGCLHLDDEEIAEVFSLLSRGSRVMIRK